MDTYFINGLHITAHIGTKSWQKTVPQKVLLDISWQSESNQSLQSENNAPLNQNQNNPPFDYEKFSQQIIDKMTTPHWDSLEIFAAELSQFIQTTWHTTWLKMTISIPHGLAYVQALGLKVELGEKRI